MVVRDSGAKDPISSPARRLLGMRSTRSASDSACADNGGEARSPQARAGLCMNSSLTKNAQCETVRVALAITSRWEIRAAVTEELLDLLESRRTLAERSAGIARGIRKMPRALICPLSGLGGGREPSRVPSTQQKLRDLLAGAV